MSVSLLSCLAIAATFYGLPPRVLASIHAVEGGELGTMHRNIDGSDDLGPMQVNTLWIPALAHHTSLDPVAVRERLRTSNCFGATAAAAILRTYLAETHGNLMLAIGHYHSHTPMLNQHYQVQVVAAATRLFGEGRAAAQAGSQAPAMDRSSAAYRSTSMPSEASAPRKATMAATSSRSR